MILWSKFWCNFNHGVWIEGILNKIYRAQHRDKYGVSSINNYDKVLNLASDPKKHKCILNDYRMARIKHFKIALC